MPPLRMRLTVRQMMLVVAVAAILCGILAALQSVRLTAQRQGLQGACYSSLNNIALGLNNYFEAHGGFPPPFETDGQGSRTHSWRIVALPWFYGNYTQPARYDYRGRWDWPANAVLSSEVPSWLSCPSECRENPHGSPFVMINDLGGKGQIPGNAILVIEAWGANRNWLSPNDRLETSPHVKIAETDHPAGFGVILRDFTVTRVKDARRIRKQGAFYVLDR